MITELTSALDDLYKTRINHDDTEGDVEDARRRVVKAAKGIQPSGDRNKDEKTAGELLALFRTHIHALGSAHEFEIIKHLETFPLPLEVARPDG